MANISKYLQSIMDAVYGEEVRGSIHDALVAMNAESSSAMEYAATAKDSAQASASSAAASASTATQKATDAANSAAAAAVSESNTSVSEQNAANKASEAADAASRAATSEQNAANSEAIASQKAAEAEASKSAAAQSAANAAAQETTTMMLRNQAEVYANQARADKEAADAAKEAAQASQDAAASSEHNAASSEEIATQKANAAESAKDAAETAKTAALNAQQAAETAQESAEDAKEDAETARDAAATSAASAATSATTARQYSGKPPRPDNTTKTWWIWDATLGEYVDSHIGSEIEGPQGVGIADITHTSGDHTPGTTDIYTVTNTDGSTYNISVWNGRNGEGAGDVLGIWFDLLIPATGWSDGQISVSDARLIPLSTYKYFIGVDEASKEEYVDCEVQAHDIRTNGLIRFTNKTDPTSDLTVQVIRFELSANG